MCKQHFHPYPSLNYSLKYMCVCLLSAFLIKVILIKLRAIILILYLLLKTVAFVPELKNKVSRTLPDSQ